MEPFAAGKVPSVWKRASAMSRKKLEHLFYLSWESRRPVGHRWCLLDNRARSHDRAGSADAMTKCGTLKVGFGGPLWEEPLFDIRVVTASNVDGRGRSTTADGSPDRTG
jgi:hypothetical protein